MSRRTLILGVGYLFLMLLVAGASYYMFIGPGIFFKTKTTPSIAKVAPVISPADIAHDVTLITLNHSVIGDLTKGQVETLTTVSGVSKLNLNSSQSGSLATYSGTISAQVIAGRFKSVNGSDIVIMNNMKEMKLRPSGGTRLYIYGNGNTQTVSILLQDIISRNLLPVYIKANDLLLAIRAAPVLDYFQIGMLVVFR